MGILVFIKQHRETFHQTVYGVCLLGLAYSLTFSPFGVSLCQIVLGANWIVEGNYRRKWQRIRQYPSVLAMAGIILVYLVGILYSDNIPQGLHEFKIKLPFLALPVLFLSAPLTRWYSVRWIMVAFIAGTFVSSVLNIAIGWGYFQWAISNEHAYSYIISHIRFSLYLLMAIIYLLYTLSIERSRHSVSATLIFGALLGWFVVYLFLLKAFTGIVLFGLTLFILLAYKLIQTQRIKLRALVLVMLAGFVVVSAYLVYDAYKTYTHEHPVDFRNLPQYTANGNKYYHDTLDVSRENGYRISLYHCPYELKRVWKQRSNMPIGGLDKREQPVYSTLVRYLTSKGLAKDSAGVMQLSPRDIVNIENGNANYLYAKALSPKGRLIEILWEIDHYFIRKGNPTNHSVTQRVEFARAAWHIIGKSPWFGIGSGDWPEAYQQAYNDINSPLSEEKRLKAHNQYLTFLVLFGVTGTIVLLLLLVAPLAASANRSNFLYLITLFVTLVSFFNEDMLDTQAGCTFAAFFLSLYSNYSSKSDLC